MGKIVLNFYCDLHLIELNSELKTEHIELIDTIRSENIPLEYETNNKIVVSRTNVAFLKQIVWAA